MFINYNNFNKPYLIKIIKIYKLKKYSKLKKKQIIDLLNFNKASILIQSFYRNKLDPGMICPITLEECKYPFICIKSYNKFRYYSLKDFIIYLNGKSEFIDPLTRENLSEITLTQINNLIKYYKINKLINNKWNKKIQLRNEYLLIINNINNIFNYLYSIDNLTINCIYTEILPQLIYYFHFLLDKHKSNCYNLIRHYINCLNYYNHENKKYLIDYFNLLIIFHNL